MYDIAIEAFEVRIFFRPIKMVLTVKLWVLLLELIKSLVKEIASLLLPMLHVHTALRLAKLPYYVVNRQLLRVSAALSHVMQIENNTCTLSMLRVAHLCTRIGSDS